MATETSVPVDFPTRLRVVRKLLLERCASVEAGRAAAVLLERIERRLQQPPRIVVLGEANSGKSTLANSLIGHDILKTDIVRNTRAPVLLRYADQPTVGARGRDGSRRRLERGVDAVSEGIARIEVGLPLEFLRTAEIIDTPGMTVDDAAIGETRRLCRSAHMAIWCTVASQAWRATEATLWAAVGQRIGPASFLAVTCAGRLGEADRDKVRGRVTREAGSSFRGLVLVGDDFDAADPGMDELRGAIKTAVAHVQAERWQRASDVIRVFADGLSARGRRSTIRDVGATARPARQLLN
jgi:energy-coupling factor transporter ATP-binding protein EcfA2